MTRIPLWLMVIIATVLAVLGGRAISAQDKYSREHAPGIPEPGDAIAAGPIATRHSPRLTGCSAYTRPARPPSRRTAC